MVPTITRSLGGDCDTKTGMVYSGDQNGQRTHAPYADAEVVVEFSCAVVHLFGRVFLIIRQRNKSNPVPLMSLQERLKSDNSKIKQIRTSIMARDIERHSFFVDGLQVKFSENDPFLIKQRL